MLERLRPSTSATEHLFVGTDRYQYFTVSWDTERKEIRTEQSYLDQADKVLRSSREADRCHVDPSRSYLTLEIYDGVVTVVPLREDPERVAGTKRRVITKRGDRPDVLGSPVQIRIEELATRSSTFADLDPSNKKQRPQLAILWEDNADIPQLKLRELQYFPERAGDQASGELKTVAEFREHLDLGVSHLVPVSHPYGGFFVLGDRSITYVNGDLKSSIAKNLEEEATRWTVWEKVDHQRWLLADEYGRLYFLMLLAEGGLVGDWQLDLLGSTSIASTLVYLDGGCVYVGSHSGDSQLVRIEEKGLNVMQTFDNIAPILDLTVMDLGRGSDNASSAEFSSGQARLVTASGAWHNGSIRSVRNGVGIEELGSLGEVGQVIDMWGLSSQGSSEIQDLLLTTFADETRILKFDVEAAIEEVEDFHGLVLTETTLLASNLTRQRILQVTESTVLVVDLDDRMVNSSWTPHHEGKITACACNGTTLVVVSGGTELTIFDLTNDLVAISSKSYPTSSQIASVAVPSAPTSICVVAFWQSASVVILSIPSLDSLYTQALGSADVAIPRSILVASVIPGADPTLFVAIVDGTVMTYDLDTEKNELSNMTKVILGSQPVTFKTLPHDLGHDAASTTQRVFTSCEQPSMIYASKGRMVYAAVSFDKASRICHLNSEAYPGAIAIAAQQDLKLGLIDQERKTQLHTLPIGETVPCVAYSEKLGMFGIGCVRRILEGAVEGLLSSFKIANEVTFRELDSVELRDGELIECVVTFPGQKDSMGEHGSDDLFVVGTSIEEEAVEQSSVKGRILVFRIDKERKLRLVTELSVKGACRCLAICDGKIVAGLVKTVRQKGPCSQGVFTDTILQVVVYTLAPISIKSHGLRLQKLAAYRTATNPLSLSITPSTPTSPALIAVADLMKSISVLELTSPLPNSGLQWTLLESARHFSIMWSSSVSVIGDNEWAAADSEGNLVVLRRNVKDVTDDDMRRLEVTSEMRLGEVVNCITPVKSPSQAETSSQHDTGGLSTAKTILKSSLNGSSNATDNDTTTTAAATAPSDSVISPCAFLATVEGGVYLLGTIHPSFCDLLMRLQQAITNVTPTTTSEANTNTSKPSQDVPGIGLGHMPWHRYRAYHSEIRTADEPFRFVDGELVEGFLELNEEGMKAVVEEVKSGMGEGIGKSSELSIGNVKALVEGLKRLH